MRREAIVAVFFCMEKGSSGNLLHGGSFVFFHRTVQYIGYTKVNHYSLNCEESQTTPFARLPPHFIHTDS